MVAIKRKKIMMGGGGTTVYDVWAMPFGRCRLGDAVWAMPFGRRDVWAMGRLGDGTFGRRDVWTMGHIYGSKENLSGKILTGRKVSSDQYYKLEKYMKKWPKIKCSGYARDIDLGF